MTQKRKEGGTLLEGARDGAHGERVVTAEGERDPSCVGVCSDDLGDVLGDSRDGAWFLQNADVGIFVGTEVVEFELTVELDSPVKFFEL